ncbi:unnamed protein product, partial [Discosporangium mesarthrocarpum]
SEVGGRGAVEQLWVCAEEGRRTLFADVSVYTRNRCFRLLGSSKHGKTATLQVARSNQRTARHMAAIQNHLVAKGVQTPVGSMEIAKMLLLDSLVVPAGAAPSSKDTDLLTVEGGEPYRFARYCTPGLAHQLENRRSLFNKEQTHAGSEGDLHYAPVT